MENTERFTGKAEVYAKARPSYPEALYEQICTLSTLSPGDRAADVGTGTGLFAKGLLCRGVTVYGVEPNGDMRAAAGQELSAFKDFRLVQGDAANTTLPDGSVKLVTAAQAFHWFDRALFARECRRILQPGGKIALVWNTRKEGSTFVQENGAVFKRYCPAFKWFSGGVEDFREIVSGFFTEGFREEHFPNDLQFDRERFLNRCRSSSYSLTEKDTDYGAYLRALNECFDRHAVNGVLTMPNEAVLYLGTV